MNQDELKFHQQVVAIKKCVGDLNADLIDVVMKYLSENQTKDFQASILSSIAVTFTKSMILTLERMGAEKFIHLNTELVQQSEEILDLEGKYNAE